jgi:hypothetical protein
VAKTDPEILAMEEMSSQLKSLGLPIRLVKGGGVSKSVSPQATGEGETPKADDIKFSMMNVGTLKLNCGGISISKLKDQLAGVVAILRSDDLTEVSLMVIDSLDQLSKMDIPEFPKTLPDNSK